MMMIPMMSMVVTGPDGDEGDCLQEIKVFCAQGARI